MECGICFEFLDLQAHCPKVLKCGHTVCLCCLQRLPRRECPTCSKKFTGRPDAQPTNFILVDVIEEAVKQKSKAAAARQWCWNCCKLAVEDCVGQHRLSDPQAALRQLMQPLDAEEVQTLTASLSDQQVVSALSLLCPADPAVSRTVTLSSEGQAALEWKVPAGRDEEGAAAAARDTGVRDRILSALTIIMVRDAVQKDRVATEKGVSSKEKRAAIEFLDVASLALPHASEKKQEKGALLKRVREHGVKKLHGMRCHRDPGWCLQILEAAAPLLEELEAEKINREHVTALLFMPRLRRLVLQGSPQTLPAPRLPQLSAHKSSSLQRLEVRGLPLKTVGDLLLAFGRSLQVLVLAVGCNNSDRSDWPMYSAGVGELLQRSGLLALRRLLLRRSATSATYLHVNCGRQVRDIRARMPGVVVLCSICDKDTASNF